jgi:RimJ/RimL family protein N-acetyltransferase
MAVSSWIIETDRLIIRPLLSADVSERYLSWLSDGEAKKWISSAENTGQLRELQQYVEQRVGRDDVCFFGIFDKKQNLHIGNIKYEPIVPRIRSAVMGVLIGDADYRGGGLFSEIFISTVQLLNINLGIDSIFLGVDIRNQVAVRAYRAVGFFPVQISDEERLLLGNVTMKYRVITKATAKFSSGA